VAEDCAAAATAARVQKVTTKGNRDIKRKALKIEEWIIHINLQKRDQNHDPSY
jgi:hypothetical protein